MKAIRYIGQALRRMATALLTALFGAILWVGALIIGGVLRIILGGVRYPAFNSGILRIYRVVINNLI